MTATAFTRSASWHRKSLKAWWRNSVQFDVATFNVLQLQRYYRSRVGIWYPFMVTHLLVAEANGASRIALRKFYKTPFDPANLSHVQFWNHSQCNERVTSGRPIFIILMHEVWNFVALKRNHVAYLDDALSLFLLHKSLENHCYFDKHNESSVIYNSFSSVNFA